MRARFEVVIVLIVLLASAALGYWVVGPAVAPRVLRAPGVADAVPAEPRIVSIPNSTAAWMYVPAVDSADRGVISTVTVQALPGSGRTLTNIEDLLFWVDTQRSIQVARAVASNVTGKNLSTYDLIYTIAANAELIEGPSAGAALAVATIAALENTSLDRSVLITGTIEPDGSIGPVGGIVQKAEAARLVNATLLLVPIGQGTEPGEGRKVKECRAREGSEFCAVRYVADAVALTDFAVTVREVRTIQEALAYAR